MKKLLISISLGLIILSASACGKNTNESSNAIEEEEVENSEVNNEEKMNNAEYEEPEVQVNNFIEGYNIRADKSENVNRIEKDDIEEPKKSTDDFSWQKLFEIDEENSEYVIQAKIYDDKFIGYYVSIDGMRGNQYESSGVDSASIIADYLELDVDQFKNEFNKLVDSEEEIYVFEYVDGDYEITLEDISLGEDEHSMIIINFDPLSIYE